MKIKLYNKRSGFTFEISQTAEASIADSIKRCSAPAELLHNMQDDGMGTHTKTVGVWTLTIVDNVSAPIQAL